MHFSEIQMDYCFTCAKHVLIVSDTISFSTLLHLSAEFATLENTHFSINGDTAVAFCVGICYPR